MTGTRIYSIWRNMKTRCYNKNFKQYKDYGGRGIKVYKRWFDSFENFYLDMGDPPEKHSLDRKNNNGNYCKSNCRWSTPSMQNNNSRSNVKFTFQGKTLTLKQWAKKLNFNYDTLRYRLLYYNWSLTKSMVRHPHQKTHRCNKCGYEWVSKKENPVGCAKCKLRKYVKKIYYINESTA